MKVSVCLITYNHERFVRTALESILEQQVEFPFEIVAADDVSSDATSRILADYRDKRAGTIRLVSDGVHRGVTGNFARALRASRGEYVALLEGDDFWTDNAKLSSQVAVLDADPNCALCFHPVITVDEDGRPVDEKHWPRLYRRSFGLRDLLTKGNFVPTCSIVVRNGVFEPLPYWFFDLPIADFPLNVLSARRGRVVRIPKTMGSWRLHSGGSFSSLTNDVRCREVVRMYDYIDQELGHAHHRVIAGVQSYWQAVESFRSTDDAAGRDFARRRLTTRPLNAQWAKACVMAASPAVYRAAARRLPK